MVRAVIGDETHVEGFIDSVLQSGVTLQVGIAVGKLATGSGRDAVFALIPTPCNGEQKVAWLEGDFGKERDTRKGIKQRPATQTLQIDMDWVGEHARQVSKMLVGGIRVVGCFVLATEATFKGSAALLWQTSKMIALALDAGLNKLPFDDLLLLHFSSSPRRTSCKNCTFESGYGNSSMRPCDWKVGKTLSTLHSISCLYNVKCRIPICGNEPSKKHLLDVFLSAVDGERARLESALFLLDGSLVGGDKALLGDSDHEVELFLPFYCPSADDRNGKINGLAILTGSIQAHAYGFSRDPWSHAIEDLKEDIANSLKSRLDILYDQVDQFSEESVIGEKCTHHLQNVKDPSKLRLKLPRRILFPWLEGIFLCDYMQDGECLQDVNNRLEELLGMKPLDESKFLERESNAAILPENSFWVASVGSRNGSRNVQVDSKKQGTPMANSVGATKTLMMIGVLSFFVLILSILASYLISNRTKSTSL